MEWASNAPLYSWTSFRLPARAAYRLRCTQPEELLHLPELFPLDELPLLPLGSGSNVVFAYDYPGIVLRADFRGIRCIEADHDTVCVEAAAGEPWHDFVATCLQNQWYGLENLALIPGTVGAAPVHNIGAYGVEVGEFLDSVQLWDRAQNTFRWLPASALGLSYRSSLLRTQLLGQVVITRVRFRLLRRAHPRWDYPELARFLHAQQLSRPSALDVFHAVIALRRSKLPDPAEVPNAGSFFKNPLVPQDYAEALRRQHPTLPYFPHGDGVVKIPAGWLLEQCGWKGVRDGPVGTWKQHALVLTACAPASGMELLRFAARLWKSVYDRFGISLEPEVLILPPQAWQPEELLR